MVGPEDVCVSFEPWLFNLRVFLSVSLMNSALIVITEGTANLTDNELTPDVLRFAFDNIVVRHCLK